MSSYCLFRMYLLGVEFIQFSWLAPQRIFKMTGRMQDRETLITLTSDIVSAHVSNNTINIDQVSGLISSVFDALYGLGAEPVVVEAPTEPAVPSRISVKPDHVTCLECGKKMKMLKRHLAVEHGLAPEEYRQRWGLSPNHALVAPNYASKRSDLAKANGLGLGGRGGAGARVDLAEAKPASKPKAKSPLPTTDASVPAAEANVKQAKRSRLIKRLQKEAEESAADTE